MESYIKENKAKIHPGKQTSNSSPKPLHSMSGTQIHLNLRPFSPDTQTFVSHPAHQQQEPVAQFFRLSLNSNPEDFKFFQVIRKIPVSAIPEADIRAAPEELQKIWSDSSLNTTETSLAFQERLSQSKIITESLRRSITEHEDIVLEGHGTFDGQISDDVHEVNSMQSYTPSMLAELICLLLDINRFSQAHPWHGRLILLGCSTGNLIQETASAIVQKMKFPITILGSSNTVFVTPTDSGIPIYRTLCRDDDTVTSQDSKLALYWVNTLQIGLNLIRTFDEEPITKHCNNITLSELRITLNELIKQFKSFNIRMAGWPIFNCDSILYDTSSWALNIYTRLKSLYLIQRIGTSTSYYKPPEYGLISKKKTNETLRQMDELLTSILSQASTPIEFRTGAGLFTYNAALDVSKSNMQYKAPPADPLPKVSISLPDISTSYDTELEILLNQLAETPIVSASLALANEQNMVLNYIPPERPKPVTKLSDGAFDDIENDFVDYSDSD